MNARVRFYAKACLFSAVTGTLWTGVTQAQSIAIRPAGSNVPQSSPARPAAQPQPAKPQAAKPQPSPIIQASGIQPAGAMGAPQQQRPQGNPNQSAVQQELEAMYRRAGREMPPMNLQDMPIEQSNARYVPPGRNAPNAPQGSGPQIIAAAPSKPSLLQRMIPSRFRSSNSSQAPASTQNQNSQNQSRPQYQPQNQPQSAQPQTAQAPVAKPIQQQPAAVQPAQPSPLPPATAASQPVRQGIAPEPVLMNEAEADAVAANEKLDDLNLDKPVATALAQPQEQVETKPAESPFSGLTLSANEAEASQSVVAPAIPEPATAVPAPSIATPAAPAISAAPVEKENPAAPAVEPQHPVVTEEIPEPQDEQSRQLRNLAARRDLKGLKGFCIVALKDKRQLIEAQPEFRSDFGNKTFSFSSSEAKAAFDDEPEAYIPAASGQDVVKLALGSVTAEGSLDHAVWYKGKLYLFSSAASRELFIESPSQFAVK